MFPHQEHVWFIGCVFNTPCPTCAFFMHCSCIAHSHLLHTPLLPLSCIDLYLVSSSQHVMFTLRFVALLFCVKIELYFLIHLAPLMHHYHYSFIHLLPLFLLDPLSILDKKGESIPECFCHFYMTLVHILRGRNSISHAHLQGERYSIRDMHIPRERRH